MGQQVRVILPEFPEADGSQGKVATGHRGHWPQESFHGPRARTKGWLQPYHSLCHPGPTRALGVLLRSAVATFILLVGKQSHSNSPNAIQVRPIQHNKIAKQSPPSRSGSPRDGFLDKCTKDQVVREQDGSLVPPPAHSLTDRQAALGLQRYTGPGLPSSCTHWPSREILHSCSAWFRAPGKQAESLINRDRR